MLHVRSAFNRRFVVITDKFRRVVTSNLHKVCLDMDKLYLRNPPDTQELQINFRYKNPELNIDREFNFSRNIDEVIDIAIARMQNNIEKVFNKKYTKKEKKAQGATSVPATVGKADMVVKFVRKSDELSAITFKDMISDLANLRFYVVDKEYEVVLNYPWVTKISLPPSIMAGFLLYPNKLEMQFADREYTKATWFKGEKQGNKPITWTKCGEGFNYNARKEDIGSYIKLEVRPGNKSVLGPPVEVIAKSEVQAGPDSYPYESRHKYTEHFLKGDEFRVISYNILADLYADSDFTRTVLFPYCPPHALSLQYRKQLLINEIMGYKGDVICLQEVDVKVFDHDFLPLLNEFGYKGVFEEKGSSGEGVATFFLSERFELINSTGLNIGENLPILPIFEETWMKISENFTVAENIAQRATTLQVTVLKSKDTGKVLVVANTHLYFRPDADHIRLLQAGCCMIYIEHVCNEFAKKLNINKNEICLVFCGDFNSVPECGIFQLMTENVVESTHADWSSSKNESVKNISFSHSFSIDSAYGTPKYTNYTKDFAACLDYIFYQTDRLSVENVIPLPTTQELVKNVAIPSVVFPSDHLALVANFKFKE